MHKIEDNMKKTYAVLAGVALIAALASCNRKAEYKTYPFATLEATSYAIAENSGVLRIPVSVFDNDGGSGSVTFVVKDGTAKEGADFTVSPSNGVLSFTGNGTQYIEIAVVDHKGVFTGNTNCSVSVTSVSGDLTLGTVLDCDVTIQDLDHPLADILGTYTATGYGYKLGEFKYTLHLTNDPKDITKVWCDWIMPMWFTLKSYGNASVYGTVSEDHSTITFPVPQTVAFNVGYGNQELYGCHWKDPEGDGYYIDEDPIVFTKVSEGVYETESGIACLDQYVWPSDGGFILGAKDGYKTTWKKQ